MTKTGFYMGMKNSSFAPFILRGAFPGTEEAKEPVKLPASNACVNTHRRKRQIPLRETAAFCLLRAAPPSPLEQLRDGAGCAFLQNAFMACGQGTARKTARVKGQDERAKRPPCDADGPPCDEADKGGKHLPVFLPQNNSAHHRFCSCLRSVFVLSSGSSSSKRSTLALWVSSSRISSRACRYSP